ncbi:MAG: hypothetical protein ACLSIK_23185, partial [Enterocloster clostridioformis]|uniref:hypothetical protein n=1 Tax=Enterocloster clostridioformis TaxID=1531 RepID=UPI00266F839B
SAPFGARGSPAFCPRPSLVSFTGHIKSGLLLIDRSPGYQYPLNISLKCISSAFSIFDEK